MSIYSRSYMRGPREEDASSPWAMKGILIALIAIFLLQNIFRHWLGSPFFEAHFALELNRFTDGWLHTILSYGFLHSTEGALPWHLVLNALLLFWFGREIEARIGSQRFLEGFLFCLLMGGAFWLAVQFLGGRNNLLVGASAGVFGILYLYCRYLWHSSLGLLFLPIRFTGKQLFLVLLGFQLFFFLFGELPGSGHNATAYSAHLGGILGAFLYERHLLARRTLLSLFRRAAPVTTKSPHWHKRAHASKQATSHNYKVNIFDSKSDLKSEIDRILDKINDHGFGSLTPEEKEILRKGSNAKY